MKKYDESADSLGVSAAVVQDELRIPIRVPSQPTPPRLTKLLGPRFVRPICEPSMVSPDFPSLAPERIAQIEEVQRRIGYVFQDRQLLLSALRHASSSSTRLKSNERLEFLGDAILGMVVCEELYHSYPDLLEGELTRIKSVVVSRETCAKVSSELGLADYLQLGKGMSTQPKLPRSLLADVLESIVAAIFLDSGLAPAREFIERFVFPFIAPTASGTKDENYKSRLQHLAQRDYSQTPVYVLVSEKGPDHSKSFEVAARIGDLEFAPAWGNSKKQAEQVAAQQALRQLEAE